MTNYQGAPLEEQVKVLLEKNLEYSKEILDISKKVKNYILWGKIMTAISLMFFVILPIVLGIVYLPTIINNTIGNFLPTKAGQPDPLRDLLGNKNVNKDDLIKMIEKDGGIFDYYQNILKQNN